MTVLTMLANPVDVTPVADDNYHNVDVSAYVPVGTPGVLLRVWHQSTALFGIRNDGSSDDLRGTNKFNGHSYYATGVNNRIFEAALASTTNWSVELLGYFGDDCVFFTHPQQSPAQFTNFWEDWDISGETGGDTALAAIMFVHNPIASVYDAGARKNGSNDQRYNKVYNNALVGSVIVGVDANEILEIRRGNTNLNFYLVGYIKAGVTMYDTGVSTYPTLSSTWQDLPNQPAEHEGLFLEVQTNNTQINWGVRPGSNVNYDDHYKLLSHAHGWAAMGAENNNVQAKMQYLTQTTIHILGHIDKAAPPAAAKNPIMHGANF